MCFAARSTTEWVARTAAEYGPPYVTGQRPIDYGGLCSGLDTPVEALRQLLPGNGLRHFFSCDKKNHCKDFVHSNFAPEMWFHTVSLLRQAIEDMGGPQKFLHTVGGMLDVLAAGFPCQPYSLASSTSSDPTRGGFQDERADVFFEILAVIRALHFRP